MAVRNLGNRGFTLLELVVGIAIIGIVMAALAPFLTSFLIMTSSGSTDGFLMQETRWAVELIGRDLAYAVNSTEAVSRKSDTPA